MKKITINPVTRIEGHAKITIYVDDNGNVSDSKFHVTQLRGFEKFCEGRPYTEMPSLTARTCGICPVSHLITASKACDDILAVSIPKTGQDLRRIIHLAQMVQSHALSFFYLSSPDFLLGMDSNPAERNVFTLMKTHPDIVADGVKLRSFGQRVIETLAGKRIHGGWIVPGGVSHKLEKEIRDSILSEIPELIKITKRHLDSFKRESKKFPDEIQSFANFPTLFMGLVNDDGKLRFYDGKVRIVDATGKIIQDGFKPKDYRDFIAEEVESDTYLKSPYYKPFGYEKGMYRVGTLARLNVADRLGTTLADEELAEFKAIERGAVLSSFYYHQARLIEILFSLEKMQVLLNRDYILDSHIRARAEVNKLEGIGIAEAPRGTLVHHYKVNEQGLITYANLIIATGNNNLAMNRGVKQVAKHFIDGRGEITEGALNRVEAVIRAFDPCLSCSTHALGKMPLDISLVDSKGNLLDRKARD